MIQSSSSSSSPRLRTCVSDYVVPKFWRWQVFMDLSPKWYFHLRGIQFLSAPLECPQEFERSRLILCQKSNLFMEEESSNRSWAFLSYCQQRVKESSINNTKVLYSKIGSYSRINSYSRTLYFQSAIRSNGAHTILKSYPLLALVSANQKCTKVIQIQRSCRTC